MDAIISLEQAVVLVDKLIQEFDRPSTAKVDLAKAQSMLKRMRAYLADHSSDKIDEASQLIQNRTKEIEYMVYDIEDALGHFSTKIPHHSHSNKFSWTAHHIKHYPSVWKASRKLSSTLQEIESGSSFSSLPTLQSALDPPISNTRVEETYNNLVYHQVVEEEDIVGFEEPKEKLIQQLMEGYRSRPMQIWIVGPGGSGKTTLVKIVYKSKRVQKFFDCQAFVDLPRTSDCRKLLLSMLSKFEDRMQEPVVHHHHHHEEIDPVKELEQLLRQKKYVVVLDNVWKEHDLGCIVKALPPGLPGSKIIITTRDSNLSSVHANSDEYIHDLSQVLSWKDVNKLFCKKAFRGNSGECPEELQGLGERILQRCEFLPIAVSAVASSLSKKPQTPFVWKKFHDSLGSDLPIVKQVWDPSYRDLPIELKCCFLYFSLFPVDYSIKRERLIRLWVAGGFVTPIRRKTREEVADGYLNELIGRYLVHVSSREIDGQVRTCRVLNLVREFIISKTDNFLILESNSASTSSTNSGEKFRHLSAHYVPISNLSRRGKDLNRTRTLLVFGQQAVVSSDGYELGKVLKTLVNLRVLDFKGVRLEDFPESIVSLSLLKYISMRKTNIKSVPSSIEKLVDLETLDLKRTQVTKLPKEIYELHNMRHLLVSHGCDQDDDGPAQGVEVVSSGNIGALPELQKLSLIKVGNNRTILKNLAVLTGLRKLGLTDLRAEHATELCCAIEKMESLSTLEVRSIDEEEYLDMDPMTSPPLSLQRLCLKGRLKSLPKWISHLHSAMKISLKRSKLDDDANPLETLEALPNLMELNLVRYYTGERLEFKKDTFKELKILHIEQFDQLNTMVVQNGAMPKLKKLTMSRCQNLELLPLGIEGLRSLDELLLYDMHNQFIARLQKDSEDRQAVEHIRVIHSFYLGSNQRFTGFQNLS